MFFVTAVTNNHFERGTYSNTTLILNKYLLALRNYTNMDRYGGIGHVTDSPDFQLFTSMLEGYNASTPSYEDLTPSQCINLYYTNLLSSHRNLFLITNHTSNSSSNGTLGFSLTHGTILAYILDTGGTEGLSWSWICALECHSNEITSNVARGLPWLINLKPGHVVEVRGCKSEITKEKCKVQFSLGIMIAVIGCNLVKACSMIMTVVRSREPTLVTLGDAIDSFLRIPDTTTIGICFADRRFIEREWRRGSKAGPRQWKQNGVQRWWTSVSKTRWITCNLFYSIAIISTGVLLQLGIKGDQHNSDTKIKAL